MFASGCNIYSAHASNIIAIGPRQGKIVSSQYSDIKSLRAIYFELPYYDEVRKEAKEKE